MSLFMLLGALSQHEQNASGEESPVEADDEMVSPPGI